VDVVYTLQAASAASVRVEVDGLAGFRPVVYLRRGACTDGLGTQAAIEAEVGCAASGAGDATHPAVATFTAPLSPGAYTLVVDSADANPDGGLFDLLVTPGAALPAGDTCANAAPLALDANGHASLGGTFSGAANDLTGSCAGAGADVVYALDLASE